MEKPNLSLIIETITKTPREQDKDLMKEFWNNPQNHKIIFAAIKRYMANPTTYELIKNMQVLAFISFQSGRVYEQEKSICQLIEKP